MFQASWSQNYGTYVISSTFLKTQTAPFKNPKVYASYSVPTWHLRSTADRINTSILRGRYSTVRFPHPFKFIIFIRLSGVEIWPQLRCRHVARRILRGKGLWCFRSQEAQLLAPHKNINRRIYIFIFFNLDIYIYMFLNIRLETDF